MSSAIKLWGTSTSQSACDSNLITQNFIGEAGIAIYINSNSSPSRPTGNIIRANYDWF